MKRVAAIAGIAVRNAVRSRLVVSLLVLLLVAIVGIPLTVKGDGTLEGHVRIAIGYTMGFASALLGLATLWAGALSIAQEIDERQVQLLVAKPVHRFQIWLGKWLGLMAVNAVLLAACGAATYGLLRWNTSGGRMADADRARLMNEVLAAHRSVAPAAFDVAEAARRVLRERMDRGELVEGVPPAMALQAVRQELLLRASTVPPGERRDWSFQLPRDIDRSEPLTLRFRFSSSQFGLEAVEGTWLAGSPDRPYLFQRPVTNVPGPLHEIQVPAGVADESGRIDLSFVNRHATPITVVFPLEDGVRLLAPAGGFEANFARALLVVLARLAFLAALGVTAGALFSTPVAAFMAMALALLLHLGGYVESLASQEVVVPWHDAAGAGPTWVDASLRLFFQALSFVLLPLAGPDAIDAAATGVLVDAAALLRAALVQVVLYGGVLALFGAFVFNRRELALPTS